MIQIMTIRLVRRSAATAAAAAAEAANVDDPELPVSIQVVPVAVAAVTRRQSAAEEENDNGRWRRKLGHHRLYQPVAFVAGVVFKE